MSVIVYSIVGSSKLSDPDLPVTFLSEQLVDLIVQIPNPELPETSWRGRGQRDGSETDRCRCRKVLIRF